MVLDPDAIRYDPIVTGMSHDNKAFYRRYQSSGKRGIVVLSLFMLLTLILIMRLGYLSFFQDSDAGHYRRDIATMRGNIVDRNGILLATQLPTYNLVVNPKKLLDVERLAGMLAKKIPDLSYEKLVNRLSDVNRQYVLIKKDLPPAVVQSIHDWGMPGIEWESSDKRFYPQGALLSHVLGYTNSQGNGVSGIERHYNHCLGSPLKEEALLHTTLDVRVQHILRSILHKRKELFHAQAAAGVVMDAKNGDILGMVSLPDYDGNHRPRDPKAPQLWNMVTGSSFEMGSTFKIINTAIALESGTVRLTDRFDVGSPLSIGRKAIRDFKLYQGYLTAAGILQHSSNRGSVRMAELFGPRVQQYYMGQLGLLRKPDFDLYTEAPQLPKRWGRLGMATMSYGYGLAVTPLHLVSTVASIVNGGLYVAPHVASNCRPEIAGNPKNKSDTVTDFDIADEIQVWQHSDKKLTKHMPINTVAKELKVGQRVLSAITSLKMRYVLRVVVESGSGRSSDVKYYPVLGKTGTAEKRDKRGRYIKGARMSSFLGAFPAHDPKYIVFAIFDDPQVQRHLSPYATGGVVAAPVVGQVIERIAPLLEVKPFYGDASALALRRLLLENSYEIEYEKDFEGDSEGMTDKQITLNFHQE